MDYLDITLRLQEIKRETHQLGTIEEATIMGKIDNLRDINRLLKEQNRLLAIKHEFINVIKLSVDPSYHAA